MKHICSLVVQPCKMVFLVTPISYIRVISHEVFSHILYYVLLASTGIRFSSNFFIKYGIVLWHSCRCACHNIIHNSVIICYPIFIICRKVTYRNIWLFIWRHACISSYVKLMSVASEVKQTVVGVLANASRFGSETNSGWCVEQHHNINLEVPM